MLRLLSAVLVSLLTIAADPPDLTGTWTWVDPASREAFTITFSGGRGTYDGEAMTYRVSGDRLTIRADGQDITYSFALRDGKLVLSGGDLQEASAFTRQGGAPAADQPAEANAQRPPEVAQPEEPTVVGKWETGEGLLTFNPDGTGTLGAKPFKYELRQGAIVMVGEKEADIVPFRLIDAGRMEVVVDGERVVLHRAAARAVDARPAAVGGGNAAGAGVYVCTESSVDPNIVMTFTQYVVLWPDGTVSYAKSEGGATRTQVTETTERFSAYRTNPEVKGQTVGRWESDGRNIVVRWELWNGLVCQGQFDGAGNLQLSKMGVLEEGATLTFQRQ